MPKEGDIKEDDYGKLIWRQPEGCIVGWWSRIEDDEVASLRTPVACPACDQLLDNWSTQYFHRWGVCSNCYYDHLDQREGLPEFASNTERAAYCRQKIEEKKKRI